MQATEILTSLRSENRTQAVLRPQRLDNCCLLRGNLTILTSLRSERPELLSKVQTKQGDRGGGWGRADNSLRSERSGTATETEQETNKTRRQEEGHKHEVREGGVRVALTERPGTTKGGFRVRQTTQRGTTGEQTRKGNVRNHTNGFRYW